MENCAIIESLPQVLVSPLVAGLAVSIGVPILLAYVYGVVPISLCRSGGCGLHTSTQGVKIDVEEEAPYTKPEVAGSRVANPSIGEVGQAVVIIILAQQ